MGWDAPNFRGASAPHCFSCPASGVLAAHGTIFLSARSVFNFDRTRAFHAIPVKATLRRSTASGRRLGPQRSNSNAADILLCAMLLTSFLVTQYLQCNTETDPSSGV